MSKFEDNMRIIRCQKVTVVDIEHTLMPKTCFTSAQNVEPIRSDVVLWPLAKSHPQSTIIWKQMCAPRVVVWKVLIVMKYFEDSLLGQSHFPCDTA
jgi:hypothetical protein